MSLVHTITTDASRAATMNQDREAGHRTVMQLWEHIPSPTARADLGALWSVVDIDLTAEVGTVLVRSTSPITNQPDWARAIHTDQATLAQPGEHTTIRADLVAQRTPSIPVDNELRHKLKAGADGTDREPGTGLCYRANPVPVPEDDLVGWASAKLERHGLTVSALTMLSYRRMNMASRKFHYPVAKIHATGTVTDADAWNAARTHGLGKGKAFGIGTIIEHPAHPSPAT